MPYTPFQFPCVVLSVVMYVAIAPLVTTKLAVPVLPPPDAVTVNGPPTIAPAVNRPVPLIVPPPLTLQLNVGWLPIGSPNWSVSAALNCLVPLGTTPALDGVTLAISV